jgi:uncharacterized membrane protein YkvA (DUF1232 family)
MTRARQGGKAGPSKRAASKKGGLSSDEAKKQVKVYKKRADRYKDDPEEAQRLVDAALKKAKRDRDPLAEVWGSLMAMLRMTRAYFKGEYRAVPWDVMAAIIAATVYFVSPIDAIPDVIPILGLTDDATVIALVVARVRVHIDGFEEWELDHKY